MNGFLLQVIFLAAAFAAGALTVAAWSHRRQRRPWHSWLGDRALVHDGQLDNLSDSVLLLDAQNCLVDLNAAALRLAGLTAAPLGRPAAEVFAGQPALADRLSAVPLAPGEVCLSAQPPRYLDLRFSPLPAAEGRRTRLLLVLADITERKQADQLIAQHARETAALCGISLAVNAQADLPQLLNTIARWSVELLGATMGNVCLLSADGWGLEIAASYHMSRDFTGVRLRLGEGVAGRVAQTGEPVVVERYDQWEGGSPVFADEHVNRVIGAPMKVSQQVVGVTVVGDVQPGPFSAEQVRLVTMFAAQAAIALENARLLDATRRHAAQLASVNRVGLAITSGLDISQVMETLYEQCQHVVSVDSFYVSLYDEATGSISFPLYRDRGETLSAPARLLKDKPGVTGYVIQTRQTLYLPDTRTPPPALVPFILRLEDEPSRSYVGVPLILRDRVLGVLSMQSRQPDAYTADQIAMLEIIASQAAIVLENAHLYATAQQELAQRQRTAEELRQAKEAAEVASRSKSEFLANVSHEIRTPLNAIVGLTSLMFNSSLSAQQEECLETIQASSDALLALVSDILDFSKIEAGKLELEQQAFDLRACLESALDLLAARAAEKGLELVYEWDAALPEFVVGDVTRLRQVLVNLVGNGVKFTSAGEVVISASLAPAEAAPPDTSAPPSAVKLLFVVRDTGLGIPADKIDRLFQSFSQVDASTTRQYGGTGLGLAISRRLVELMGGRLWVESAGHPGLGSTFSFTITVELAHDRRRPLLAPEFPALVGKRLLIVDDNAASRRMLTACADAWHMLPHVEASSHGALALLSQPGGAPAFDVALIDAHLPERDGVALAQALGSVPGAARLPLVLLSSLGQSPADLSPALFAAYVNKPVKPATLAETLTQVVTGTMPPGRRRRSTDALLDPNMSRRCPLRILLAEDHIVNQKVALRLLERLGYRADVAASGLEVLEAVRRQPYDVVLMDIQMPEMDGLEAARVLRAELPADRQPRIIAMTANALPADAEKYKAAGLCGHIVKPVRGSELAHALQTSYAVRYGGEAVSPAPPEAVEPEPAAGTILDEDVYDQFVAVLGRDQPEAVREVLDAYLGEISQQLARWRQGMPALEAREVERFAHSLRSSSALLGAASFSELCRQLEVTVREQGVEAASGLVARLEADFGLLQMALRAEMNRLGR